MQRRDRWTTVLTLGCLLLAGCSTAEQASTSLPPTAAPTTTTTAAAPTLPPLGPAELPMPAEARQQTPEGAAAFTRYYVDLVNYATRTLDPTGMRQLSRDCEECDQTARGIDDTRSKGYVVEGDALTITSMGPANITGEEAGISFLMDEASGRVLDANGSPVPGRGADPGVVNSGLALLWDPAMVSWLTTQFNTDPLP